MSTTLIIIVVILFIIGAWPVAIAVVIFAFATKNRPNNSLKTENHDIESLRKENEKLKHQLGEKIIDDVISKTENRGGR